MFYSKSTRGFYSKEINGDNIPEDAVNISMEDYENLLKEQSSGKEIVAEKNGYPVAKFIKEKIFKEKSLTEKLSDMGIDIEELKTLLLKKNIDESI